MLLLLLQIYGKSFKNTNNPSVSSHDWRKHTVDDRKSALES